MKTAIGITTLILVLLYSMLGCSDDPTVPTRSNPVDREPRDPLMIPTLVNEFTVNATAMTINQSGHIVFSDPFGNRIMEYNTDGTLVAEWNPVSKIGAELFPMYIEYASGKLFIISATPHPNRMVVYDTERTFQTEWYLQDEHSNWPGGPDQITIDDEGFIYTLRWKAESVVKYRPDGSIEREWLTHGTNPTGWNWPGGIVVGPNRIVYISDPLHDRILMFLKDGRLVGEIGEEGSGNGQFRSPYGLAIDEDEILYVVDKSNLRIQKLTLDGEYLGEFSSGAVYKTPYLITTHGNMVHVWHSDDVVRCFEYEQ